MKLINNSDNLPGLFGTGLPQNSDGLSGLRHKRHARNGLVADYAISLTRLRIRTHILAN
jgi:hypothetical protein